MFLKNPKRDSRYYQRICQNHKEALEGYPYHRGISESILPSLTTLFNRLTLTKIDWSGKRTFEASYFEDISDIARHVALNTQAGEVITGIELEYLEKIFEDLNTLIDYALSRRNKEYDEIFTSKLKSLNKIACKNMVNMKRRDSDNNPSKVNTQGKIFETYENLYQVIHRICSEWEDLCARGFSLQIWYAFRNSFEYDLYHLGLRRSEKEKIENFLGILNGTIKLVPQYELKAVSYQPVPANYSGEKLIRNIPSPCDKEKKLETQKQ